MRPKRSYRILLACLDLLTAATFVALVTFIWTRSTLFVVGALVQAVLGLASAAGLIIDRPWSRWLVRVSAWYQLGLLALILLGIVLGASTLWGLYGDVGTGAAVMFLVIGLLLFEILGLLPVYKLRAVGLRDEPRAGPRRWLPWTLGGLGVLVLGLSLVTRTVWAYPAWEPLPATARDALMARLVAAAHGGATHAAAPAGDAGEGDLYVLRLVRAGRTRHRAQAQGEPERVAARLAATIPDRLRAPDQTDAVVVDRVVAHGPVPETTALFSLAVVPGLDGLAGRVDGRRAVLLPQELIDKRLLTRERPIPFVPDFRAGVRRAEAERELCSAAGAKRSCRVEDLERIRTESWYACADGRVHRRVRGRPPRPAPSKASALAAALAAGDYVLNAQGEDGRFVYLRDPRLGKSRGRAYTLPRHAGTTWFLAQLYRETGDRRYLAGAQRGLAFLQARLVSVPGDRLAVTEGKRIDLGVQALSLIAFAEVAQATPEDVPARARVRALAAMLRDFQKPDGDFFFTYDLKRGATLPGRRKFYAAGQASLALAKAARLLGDEDDRAAARRAMDFMAGPYWDFWLGGFFFIEEHWTCLAAREAWGLFEDPAHAQLCVDIGRFTLQLQHGPGAAFPDYVGGVGFSDLFPPHTTPTASRAEALIAAAELATALGDDASDLRAGVRDAIGFLMHNQIRAEEGCLLADPAAVMGGVGWNYLNPDLRIDTAQHAGSVMLLGSSLLD